MTELEFFSLLKKAGDMTLSPQERLLLLTTLRESVKKFNDRLESLLDAKLPSHA